MTTVDRSERTQAWVWNQRVASNTLAGEAFVMLDGTMIRLNSSATAIWNQFRQPHALVAVAQRLAAEFDVTAVAAERDVAQLVDTLTKRGLLVDAS